MSFIIIIGIIISHVLLAQSSYNEDNDSSVDCRKDCVESPGSETFSLSLQTWVTSHIIFLDNMQDNIENAKTRGEYSKQYTSYIKFLICI